MKSTYQTAKRWNPHISVSEMEKWAWSAWSGCEGREFIAEHYFAICVAECGFRHVDNDHGMGYSGGTWPTIIKCFQRDGMVRPVEGWRVWARKRPFLLNKRLANHFMKFVQDSEETEAVKTWHRGPGWRRPGKAERDAEKYLKDVDSILGYYYGVKDKVLGEMYGY